MLARHELPCFRNLTYRQIDYWARKGYVTPAGNTKGSGTRRRWSPRDVARLHVLDRLATDMAIPHHGLPPAWVRAVWDALEHDWPLTIHINPATGVEATHQTWVQSCFAYLAIRVDPALEPT